MAMIEARVMRRIRDRGLPNLVPLHSLVVGALPESAVRMANSTHLTDSAAMAPTPPKPFPESPSGNTWLGIVMPQYDGDMTLMPPMMIYRYRVLLALDLARALQGLHSIGVVHLDMNRCNVLVDLDNRCFRLGDYGIARVMGDGRAGAEEPPLDECFLNGWFCCAPEHVVGDGTRDDASVILSARVPCDPATDIWNLGMLLAEFFEEQPPSVRDSWGGTCAGFQAWLYPPGMENSQEAEDAHIRSCLPTQYSPRSHSELWDVVAQMLRKDPARRPSATQVLDLLASYDAQRPALAEAMARDVTHIALRKRQARGPVATGPVATTFVDQHKMPVRAADKFGSSAADEPFIGACVDVFRRQLTEGEFAKPDDELVCWLYAVALARHFDVEPHVWQRVYGSCVNVVAQTTPHVDCMPVTVSDSGRLIRQLVVKGTGGACLDAVSAPVREFVARTASSVGTRRPSDEEFEAMVRDVLRLM